MKINITAIGGDEATVTFETDEPAYAQVQFGTSRNYSNSTSLLETLEVSHSLTIRGLSQSTTYYVRVRAIDPAGNLLCPRRQYSFHHARYHAPFIYGGHCIRSVLQLGIHHGIRMSRQRVWWNTERRLHTTKGGVNANLDLAHQMQLTGLKGDTTYHYRVTSADVSNNSATSNDGTFTTPSDTVPPIISAITSVSTDGVSATIKWRTDEDEQPVEYGQQRHTARYFPPLPIRCTAPVTP